MRSAVKSGLVLAGLVASIGAADAQKAKPSDADMMHIAKGIGYVSWGLQKCPALPKRTEMEFLIKTFQASLPPLISMLINAEIMKGYMAASDRGDEIGEAAACKELPDRAAQIGDGRSIAPATKSGGASASAPRPTAVARPPAPAPATATEPSEELAARLAKRSYPDDLAKVGRAFGHMRWALDKCGGKPDQLGAEQLIKNVESLVHPINMPLLQGALKDGYAEAEKRADQIWTDAACAEVSKRVEAMADLETSQSVRFPPPTPMTMTDLKLDKSQLIGKSVKVSGLLAIFAEGQGHLRDSATDTLPVRMSFAKVTSRDQRKDLIEKCRGYPGCQITVTGVVANLPLGVGIEAKSVEVK